MGWDGDGDGAVEGQDASVVFLGKVVGSVRLYHPISVLCSMFLIASTLLIACSVDFFFFN